MSLMRRWICLPISCCCLFLTAARPLSAYEATDRWNWTATNGSTGTWGTPVTLTWSLAADGTQIPDGASLVSSDLITMLDTEFGVGPGGNNYTLRPWFSSFENSYARLSELAGLDFVYEPNDDGVNFSNSSSARGLLGVRGDIRLGGRTYGASSTTLASNYFPDYGEMLINTDRGSYFDNSPNDFLGFRNTIMHETLHGVGVSHVSGASPGFLMEPLITTGFDGPQLDDILALQRLYGDVLEKNGGNDDYASATPLGVVHTSQIAAIGLDGGDEDVLPTQTDFVSIDDNSDYDFYSFSLIESLDVAVEIVPQGASYITGPESGPTSTLDTRALSDLSLTLYDGSGVNVLAAANNNGLGGGESLSLSLDAGNYYARVSGTDNDVQLYQLTIAAAGDPDMLTWTGVAGSVWDALQTANFENDSSADVFANFDSVLFNDSAQTTAVDLAGNLNPTHVAVEGTADYTFSGAGALTGGSVTINTTGTVEWSNSGNSYSGPTLVEAGTLILSGDTSAMQSSITVAAGATLIMDSNVAGNNASEFLILPGGTLQIGRQTPNSEADVFPNNPIRVENHGQIRILDYESINGVEGTGDLIAVAELAIFVKNSYTGQTRVEAGATIQPTDDDSFGSTSGNTVVEAGGTIIARDDTFGVGTLRIDEDFVLAGAGDGNGALQITQSTSMTLGGEITIASGGATVSVSDGSSLVHTGTFDATAGRITLDIAATNVAAFSGEAIIGPGGLAKQSAGPAIFSGAAALDGPIDVEAGELIFNGSGVVAASVDVAAGASFRHDGVLTFAAASSLTGGGQIVGDTTMPGTIDPGGAGVANLSWTDALTLTSASRVLLDIGGVDAGQFDTLLVADEASLAGTLEVRAADFGGGLYEAEAGDLFTLLVAGTVAGAFDELILPDLSADLAWEFELFPDSAILAVVQAETADVNLDGRVNGADFLALQRTGAGLIGQWQREFGIGEGPDVAAAAASIPEPTTFYLASLIAGSWLLGSTRCFSRREDAPVTRAA